MMKKMICLCFVFLSINTLLHDAGYAQRIIDYAYEETQCADPWEEGLTTEEKKTELKVFFEKQKIEWKAIRVVQDTVPRVYCEACDCGTGFTFFVRVKKQFSKKMERIGFKRSG